MLQQIKTIHKELKLRISKEQNPYYRANKQYFDELFALISQNRCNFIQMLNRRKQKKYPKIIPSYQHLKCWIDDIVPEKIFSSNYTTMTKCFWIIHGMTEFPRCNVCFQSEGYIGKNVKSMDYQNGYSKYCCKECGNKGGQTRTQQTNLKKYGNICSLHGREQEEKTKNTWIRNYGVDNPLLSETIKNRIRNTIDNYSIEKKNEIAKKKEQKCLQHFGVSHQFKSAEIQEKCKMTIKMHLGEDNYFKTQIHKERMSNPILNKSRMEKQFKTKQRNNSFNISIQEDFAYQMLKFIFPKIERQYKSDSYPFASDFYDPRQPNVRFEYQGSWTHGKHPFDEKSSTDLISMMKMLVKDTEYYRNAIQTWLTRDPIKREIAQKNDIILVEFWSINDVRDFVVHYFDSMKN